MTNVSMFRYVGSEILELMEEAVNYNAFLLELIAAYAERDHEILDFGAGAGDMARRLVGRGCRVTCIEPDTELRARLTESGLAAHSSLETIPPGSVDLIYTLNVLEHITDDVGTVARLRACLKPGGRLLVYVPAFPILYSSMDRKVGHVRRYRSGGLAAAITAAGMTVERLHHCDSLGFFAALLFRLTDPGNGRVNRRVLIAYDRYVFPLSRRLDRWLGRWFGKNLLAVASAPD